MSARGVSSSARVCSCDFAWCKRATDDELAKLTAHRLPGAGHEERAKKWLDILVPSADPETRTRWLSKRKAGMRPRFKAWHFAHTAWYFREEFSKKAKARIPKWELTSDAIPSERKWDPPPRGVAAHWDAHRWVVRGDDAHTGEKRALTVTIALSPPRKRLKPLERLNNAAMEKLQECSELSNEEKILLFNLIRRHRLDDDDHNADAGGADNRAPVCVRRLDLPPLTDSDSTDDELNTRPESGSTRRVSSDIMSIPFSRTRIDKMTKGDAKKELRLAREKVQLLSKRLARGRSAIRRATSNTLVAVRRAQRAERGEMQARDDLEKIRSKFAMYNHCHQLLRENIVHDLAVSFVEGRLCEDDDVVEVIKDQVARARCTDVRQWVMRERAGEIYGRALLSSTGHGAYTSLRNGSGGAGDWRGKYSLLLPKPQNMLEWLRRRGYVLSDDNKWGWYDDVIRRAAERIGNVEGARAVVVIAEDATSCTACLDMSPTGRFIGDTNVNVMGVDCEDHQGGDLEQRQNLYREYSQMLASNPHVVARYILQREERLVAALSIAQKGQHDYLAKVSSLHEESRASSANYLKLGRLESKTRECEAALAKLSTLKNKTHDPEVVRPALNALFKAMRTPADHVHEIRIVLLTGDEYVVGRFASKGGIRIAVLASIMQKLAARVSELCPRVNIMFNSRTDGESAPLRNHGGLCTALSFTQKNAVQNATAWKKLYGVTSIYANVEKYIESRMDMLINALALLWPPSAPPTPKSRTFRSTRNAVSVQLSLLSVNGKIVYVGVRLVVTAKGWQRFSCDVCLGNDDEEALTNRSDTLASIVEDAYAEDLHPKLLFDDEDLRLAVELFPRMCVVYQKCMATMLRYKRLRHAYVASTHIWQIVAFAFSCREHHERGWEFSKTGAWWPNATCSVCVPHTVKNIAQVIIKACCAVTTTFSMEAPIGDAAVELKDVRASSLVRILLELQDEDVVTVKSALLGSGDKQHTELMKSIFDQETWIEALWDAGLEREAATFEVINNLLAAFQDTGLTARVRKSYLDCGERAIRALLGAELYVPGIPARQRVLLRNQAENLLCTIESARRAHQHVFGTPGVFMVERQVGSQDSQERSFSRIPAHTSHRGNADIVARAGGRADSVEALGGVVAQHSLKYDVDTATLCRASDWNNGGGIRLHARRSVHGGSVSTMKPAQDEVAAYQQYVKRKRSALRAGRGSDMTVRMFHKKYA